tara:strand:+ start:1564 stop:2031 length:468 start_codon:yes stop_codon:yes gene_type:complete
MNNNTKNSEVNLYYIKSNFNNIALNLCKKLLDKKILIVLKDETEMVTLDKFLWTKEKDSFIPHKIISEKIYPKDNLILCHGDYSEIKGISNYDVVLISPNIQIKRVLFLKKLFLFSYQKFEKSMYTEFYSKIKDKVSKLKCFYEYDILKWQSISN